MDGLTLCEHFIWVARAARNASGPGSGTLRGVARQPLRSAARPTALPALRWWIAAALWKASRMAPTGRPGDLARCGWAERSAEEIRYHDEEWGTPSRDDRHLFEMLSLEGAQAGLSWTTILRKREGYRRAFAGFDPAAVARFTPRRIARLVADPGIVRHRGKIESVVANAARVLEVVGERGSFAAYVWSFTDGEPVVNRWRRLSEIPAETVLSRALSKDLRQRGFRFVGPTTCYAFLQAVGVVDDHLLGCFRRAR